jgi:hypothetical protein
MSGPPALTKPTAVQASGAVHATDAKELKVGSGDGLGTTVQAAPSHDSVSVVVWPPVVSEPTAMHELVRGQETPERRSFEVPGALGAVWTLQVLPLQRSATGGLLLEYPTAVQALAPAQDTDAIVAPALPSGLGIGSEVQLVPFQLNANGVLGLLEPW